VGVVQRPPPGSDVHVMLANAKPCQMIAFDIDDCNCKNARKLWGKIPKPYSQQATFYPDQYVLYEGMIPAA
jgi:hypothetical protein